MIHVSLPRRGCVLRVVALRGGCVRADSSQAHLVLVHAESPGKPAGSGDSTTFGFCLGTSGKFIATPASRTYRGVGRDLKMRAKKRVGSPQPQWPPP